MSLENLDQPYPIENKVFAYFSITKQKTPFIFLFAIQMPKYFSVMIAAFLLNKFVWDCL